MKLCEPLSTIAGTAVGERPEGPQPHKKSNKNSNWQNIIHFSEILISARNGEKLQSKLTR